VGYIFEGDPAKAKTNVRKHAVTFDEASTIFGDPLNLLMADPDHSRDEERYLLLGMSSPDGRLPVVAFAERPPQTRFISARRATRQERRRYEEER